MTPNQARMIFFILVVSYIIYPNQYCFLINETEVNGDVLMGNIDTSFKIIGIAIIKIKIFDGFFVVVVVE